MRLSFLCSVILLGAGCRSMSPTTSESKSTETPMPNDSNVAISPLGATANGQEVHLYTLTNANGLVAKVSTYGALLTEMHVPDRDGQLKDITLGFKDLKSYEAGHPYFGATIGRYGNRIAKGTFTLHGKSYTLATNNDANHLHGGLSGFDKKVWSATPMSSDNGSSVALPTPVMMVRKVIPAISK